MDDERIASIIIICMFIVFGLLLILGLILLAESPSTSVTDFCMKNGYAGVQMLSIDSGRCFSYTTGEKRYFGIYRGDYSFEDGTEVKR